MIDRVVWCDRGWFAKCYYGFCPSEKAWHREIDRLDRKKKSQRSPYPTSDGRCTIFEDDNGKTLALVTVHESWDREGMSPVLEIFTHEATHVFQEFAQKMGEKEPSREFEAYSIANIAGELFRAYLKTRRPRLVMK